MGPPAGNGLLPIAPPPGSARVASAATVVLEGLEVRDVPLVDTAVRLRHLLQVVELGLRAALHSYDDEPTLGGQPAAERLLLYGDLLRAAGREVEAAEAYDRAAGQRS